MATRSINPAIKKITMLNNKIYLDKLHEILKSFDLQKLNMFTARIRSHRFPDVYKGKGILFKNETIRLKSGKNK
jgi:ribosomal protein L6P/L9E